MKFLCENCKAKYQIADDKVAGRTVRMKCRKCGNMIEVEASVTETSVASKMPQDPGGPRLGASTGVSAPKTAVQAAAMGLPPPRSPATPPPRPPTGENAARPLGTPAPASSPLARPSAPKPVPRPAAGTGLAGAFSRAVVAPPHEDPSSVSAAMAVLSSSSSTEEWYVGINGVPVGPVRLSELRRKAAAGLITDDSLVWREGFEEWVPLRTFPELSAMLKEPARTSLTPTPPTGPAPSLRPAAPAAPAGSIRVTSGARPSPPQRNAVATAGRSNVVAITSRSATAEKIEGLGELDEEVGLQAEAALPEPHQEPAAAAAALPSVDDAAPPKPAEHPRLSTRIAQSSRAHPALWIVVALGGMLVGVAAMVFLLPKADNKPAVQIVSVMVPAPPPPAPAASAEGEGTTTLGAVEVGATAVTPRVGSGTATGSKLNNKQADPGGGPTAPPLSPSLTGLGGLVSGPALGPGGGPSPSGGGQPLAAADVERVVQSHRAFVKRQCWETALAGKSPSAPSGARVVASMTVAADGHVASSNASGGEAFPGLAACVQNQVKSWKFPPSDGNTPVQVPFVFAAQ